MKTFVKDQSDIQRSKIKSLEENPPTVANLGIRTARVEGSDDEYTCEIEVYLSNVAEIEGNSLSVNITCSENSDFDTTIEGSGSEPSPFDSGVMTSFPLTVEIPAGTEEYTFTVILSEDGTEIETQTFQGGISFSLSE